MDERGGGGKKFRLRAKWQLLIHLEERGRGSMTGDLRVTKKVFPLPSIGKEAMENRIERERLGKITTDLFPPPTTTYLFSEERTNERT